MYTSVKHMRFLIKMCLDWCTLIK